MKSKFLNIILIIILLVSSLYIYIPKTHAADSWSTGAAGGTARFRHSGVLYNGKIYFFWGYNTWPNLLNIIDIYDIATNSWSTGISGGTARTYHTSVLNNSKIYSWGGMDSGSNYLNTLDIYDIESNSWSTGTAGGTARRYHTSVVYNGKIYSWGGYNGSPLNTIDIYDIATNSWSTGISGGTARSYHTSTLNNSKIYSWGGTNLGSYFNTIDIYDIATNSWFTGTSGGTARYSHTSVLWNGKIYSWGGKNSSSAILDTLDIYDTGIHPSFENLPSDTRPINIDEGQVITTPTYNLEVKPEGGNGVTQVEFKVDGNLICTDTTADADGVYSCLWDTTTYHSDIEVIAYFVSNDPITLTRTVIVQQDTPIPSDVTVLPATGMDI